MTDDFAIVIIHYGNVEITKRCLESIFASNETAPKIFVVDNSSNFNLNFPSVNVFNACENLGFGKAINFALKRLVEKGFEKFLIINNDVIFPKEFLGKLKNYLSNDEIAENSILSFQIRYYPEIQRIWYNGGYVDKLRMEGAHFDINKKENEIAERNLGEIDFFTGAAFYISAETFNKIGGFDEKFFLYYEDLDFSFRAIQKEVRILFLTELQLYHFVSANTRKAANSLMKFNNEIYYSRIKNKIIIIKRYTTGIYIVTSSISLTLKILKYFAMFLFSGDFVSVKFLLKKIIEGLRAC